MIRAALDTSPAEMHNCITGGSVTVPSNMALVRTRRQPVCLFNRRAAARRTTPR
jgi:hypothetical protein